MVDTGKLVKKKPVRRRPGRPKAADMIGQEDPRTRLEEVAIRVFAQHGYDAVSTGDIAREAGLTQPMVHYHFGSKEALWKAAMTRLMHSLGTRFPTNTTELKDLGPIDRLKVMTRRFILVSGFEPTLSKIILHESLSRSERLEWLIDQYVRRGFGEFDDVFNAGIAAGLIKDLPLYAITNSIISASSCAFAFAAVVDRVYGVDVTAAERIEEIADTLIEIVFHGVVSQIKTA